MLAMRLLITRVIGAGVFVGVGLLFGLVATEWWIDTVHYSAVQYI